MSNITSYNNLALEHLAVTLKVAGSNPDKGKFFYKWEKMEIWRWCRPLLVNRVMG